MLISSPFFWSVWLSYPQLTLSTLPDGQPCSTPAVQLTEPALLCTIAHVHPALPYHIYLTLPRVLVRPAQPCLPYSTVFLTLLNPTRPSHLNFFCLPCSALQLPLPYLPCPAVPFSLCCHTVAFVLLCSALPDVVFHCSRYPTLQFPLPCLAVPFPALQSHLPILPYRVLCSTLPYPIHPCRLVYSSCHAVSFVLPCLTLPNPIVSFTLFCHTISFVLPCLNYPAQSYRLLYQAILTLILTWPSLVRWTPRFDLISWHVSLGSFTHSVCG